MTTRRDFLKSSVLASSLLFVPKFLHALDRGGMPGLRDANGRRLVVIQLGGGNDGLNTIVPYRNDLYYQARPTLALREQSGLLSLDKDLAMHPAMAPLKALYDQGQLAVLNSVGYPNPDRSHFRSMDIWHTASASDEYLSTGWLGRYLDAACSGSPAAYAGIEVDDTLSLAMKGNGRKGLALKNPAKLREATRNRLLAQVARESAPGITELDYLYKTLAETASSADYIYEKAKVYKSAVEYPNTEFAKSLKTAAELINSGLDSRVYYAALSGFDTHVRQQEQQAKLLQDLSQGIGAFVGDLQRGGQFDSTLIMVFSEFGRRVSQNASNGTDHGTANNVLLIGGKLRTPGVVNDAPDLVNLDAGDLRYQVDFRSIYATILHDWLGTDEKAILHGGPAPMVGLV
jgi:uncharacterized protein (DUF1501 family)